ncbi:MAG: hypothetical protein J1E04_05475 [Alistipes sp.]|nr:hypothetical protein [Alistipes sp.]
MKKYLMLFATLCACVSACKKESLNDSLYEEINIPRDISKAFPDPNFRAYVLEQFDTNNNGVITREEALAVTKIDVYNCEIASLEGIQYFTNLTHLDCSSNQLTELNVSNNKALIYLECGGNQLTTLDISKNTVLKELGCWQNKLESLNLRNNPSLKNLRCNSNKIKNLDISKNLALEWFVCSTNELTTLDVSKHTKLKSLFCSNNKLSELNLTNNTKLELLQCGGSTNKIKEIDLSKTNIGNSTETYYAILLFQYMTSLKTLYLKKGWSIYGITYNRSTYYIPSTTNIVFVD